MDASLFFFLLCLGWLAMLWMLKAGLDQVESNLVVDEALPRQVSSTAKSPQHARPDTCHEVIGSYRDTPIFGNISVGGVAYRFDHIQPEAATSVAQNELCIAPGLVYVRRPESTRQE